MVNLRIGCLGRKLCTGYFSATSLRVSQILLNVVPFAAVEDDISDGTGVKAHEVWCFLRSITRCIGVLIAEFRYDEDSSHGIQREKII